ncbi:hypothetical protein BDZ45DRAFT_743940 [Acephala macrosclerotiorum]|nr:hypothetical protein BDZ45DRAFT_743940 [Acephala macrosclerotiorum]
MQKEESEVTQKRIYGVIAGASAASGFYFQGPSGMSLKQQRRKKRRTAPRGGLSDWDTQARPAAGRILQEEGHWFNGSVISQYIEARRLKKAVVRLAGPGADDWPWPMQEKSPIHRFSSSETFRAGRINLIQRVRGCKKRWPGEVLSQFHALFRPFYEKLVIREVGKGVSLGLFGA